MAEDPTVDNWVALLKDLKGEGFAKYPVTFYGSHGNLDSIFGAAFGVPIGALMIQRYLRGDSPGLQAQGRAMASRHTISSPKVKRD